MFNIIASQRTKETTIYVVSPKSMKCRVMGNNSIYIAEQLMYLTFSLEM